MTFSWKEHAALIVGFLAAIFYMLRIVAISNFNYETAYAILQGGTASILIGTLITGLPILAALTIVAMPLFYYSALASNSNTHWRALLTIILATLIIAPLDIFFLALGGSGLMMGLGWVISKFKILEKLSRFVRSVLAAFVALTIIANSPPWWPLEQIKISGVKGVRTGYVIDSGSTFTILNNSSRKIEYFNSNEHKIQRSICDPYQSEGRPTRDTRGDLPLIAYGNSRPGYPRCP